MRHIKNHHSNPLNQGIEILAIDGPGPGGANHVYELSGAGPRLRIEFQNGPIKEAGANGTTNEALIAVSIDRLRGFQFERNADGTFNPKKKGTYACKENAEALGHLEKALAVLHRRTKAREKRGVEGTHQK